MSIKKKARELEAANARCRHLLNILYRQHGPRGVKCAIVPFKKFAAMPTSEVRSGWDFADRFLMHQVAKSLAQYDEISKRPKEKWRSPHLDRFVEKAK